MNRFKEETHAWGFLGDPVIKNLPCNAGASGWIPGQGIKIPHALGQLSPVQQLENLCAAMEDPP